jgi:hypothetical protein
MLGAGFVSQHEGRYEEGNWLTNWHDDGTQSHQSKEADDKLIATWSEKVDENLLISVDFLDNGGW